MHPASEDDASGSGELIPGEPANRLPEAARTYWRVVGGGSTLLVVVAGMAAGVPLGVPPWALLLGFLVVGAVLIGVVPTLRWRRWRYEIRADEIDLQRGVWSIERTLVPIRRVQHVETEKSWLQGEYGLSSVTFYTAAGGVAIPALAQAEAEQVRRRVTELAKTLDDV